MEQLMRTRTFLVHYTFVQRDGTRGDGNAYVDLHGNAKMNREQVEDLEAGVLSMHRDRSVVINNIVELES
jgi:hypothetical protein